MDAGRPVTALKAYRLIAPSLGGLLLALAVVVPVQIVLDLTFVLIPVALFLLVRWSLLGVVLGVEHGPGSPRCAAAARVTRGHWWRTATVVAGHRGPGAAAGPGRRRADAAVHRGPPSIWST